jgi:hypothetical protein
MIPIDTVEVPDWPEQDAAQAIVCTSRCGRSSEAEHQLPKLRTRVRFPSPALFESPMYRCFFNRPWLRHSSDERFVPQTCHIDIHADDCQSKDGTLRSRPPERLALVLLGVGEGERDRRSARCCDEAEPKTPEVAGVARAVPLAGKAGQLGPFLRLPGPPALESTTRVSCRGRPEPPPPRRT